MECLKLVSYKYVLLFKSKMGSLVIVCFRYEKIKSSGSTQLCSKCYVFLLESLSLPLLLCSVKFPIVICISNFPVKENI